jgi:hypothetical protein
MRPTWCPQRPQRPSTRDLVPELEAPTVSAMFKLVISRNQQGTKRGKVVSMYIAHAMFHERLNDRPLAELEASPPPTSSAIFLVSIRVTTPFVTSRLGR